MQLKQTRITERGEIIIEGEFVGKLKKSGKVRFASFKYNLGLNSQELRKVADMMEEVENNNHRRRT